MYFSFLIRKAKGAPYCPLVQIAERMGSQWVLSDATV